MSTVQKTLFSVSAAAFVVAFTDRLPRYPVNLDLSAFAPSWLPQSLLDCLQDLDLEALVAIAGVGGALTALLLYLRRRSVSTLLLSLKRALTSCSATLHSFHIQILYMEAQESTPRNQKSSSTPRSQNTAPCSVQTSSDGCVDASYQSLFHLPYISHIGPSHSRSRLCPPAFQPFGQGT